MANALKLVDRAQDESRNDAAARRLRGLIAEGRLSASEIARQVGLTQAAMSRRTTGFTPMTLDEFAAICEAGSFNIVYVLTGEGDKRSPHPAGPNGGECAVRDLNPEPADLDAARRRIASRISYAPLVPIAA